MKNTVRGLVMFPVLTGILLVAGGAVIGAGAMYLYGRMHGGGLGDGSEIGVVQADLPVTDPVYEVIPESTSETIPETVPETTEPPTDPPTEPATEMTGVITIRIEGNLYYYQDQETSLSALMASLHYTQDVTVKIIKQNASRNASVSLKQALEHENILYTEEIA